MVTELLELELQIVVGFYIYSEWNLGGLEDTSGFLNAKVFSNPNVLFLIMFPVQGSQMRVRHLVLIKKWNSPSCERIILGEG